MHRVAGARLDRQATSHFGSGGPGFAGEGRRATIWIDRALAAGMFGQMAEPGSDGSVGETPQLARPATLSIPRPLPAVRLDNARADAPHADALISHPADLQQIAALDALALAAIVCDPAGRVLACSRRAAAVLGMGVVLARAGDRLVVPDAHGQARLRAAIIHCAAAADRDGERLTLALAAPDALPIRIDVAPLPAVDGCGRCVVTLTENRPGPHAVEQLVCAFGLTRAEAEVAIDLAHGLSAREIAQRRTASSDTVRKQTQAIFQKLGVAKATRLAFVLGPFLR